MEEPSSKNLSFGDSLKGLLPGADASPGPGAGADPGPGPGADAGPDPGAGMDFALPSSESGFKDFSSASVVEGSKDFLESNSWVAKIAFLLMSLHGRYGCISTVLQTTLNIIMYLIKEIKNPIVRVLFHQIMLLVYM